LDHRYLTSQIARKTNTDGSLRQHHAGADADVEMSVDIGGIASRYPGRARRTSLRAVAELRARLPAHAEPPAIAVVGTNGKTSTTTYLARLLTAAGVRTGRYTSPHLSSWGERVTVDGVPCEENDLAATLEEVHGLAANAGLEQGDLRFFDVLTLAAELIFARRGVELAVYEAGIGGRLDAVRLLQPRLTLLTSVARDHAEILGGELGQILREKLLVAPAAGTVLALPLPGRLGPEAESIAVEADCDLVWVDAEAERLPARAGALAEPLRRSLALALAGRRAAASEFEVPALTGAEPEEIDLDVPGRYERGRYNDIAYLLDSAHNEAAWRELAAHLVAHPLAGADALVALVSVSPDKDRGALAEVIGSLPGLNSVVATRHLELPAVEPDVLAADLRRAALDVEIAEDPSTAVSLAFERARELGGGVVVLGSTHLAGEVRGRLAPTQL
jgi:dihydrofolate synthase/folylpolyglutamate synthase